MKLTPADFEVVDRLQDNESWDLDNSCSWIYGLTPTAGQVANLCAIIEPTSTPTPIPPTPKPPKPTNTIFILY